jgi:hypothetical protein
MKWLVILACIIFGYMRLTMNVVSEIHHEDIFKDLAHLFVGGLFGAAILATEYKVSCPMEPSFRADTKDYWLLAVGMTILEVVAFVIHKP